jgi:hypothetical protein
MMRATQETNTITPVASILQRRPSEPAIDATLEDSFPASDPPSWTLGIEKAPKSAAFSQEEEEGNPETS